MNLENGTALTTTVGLTNSDFVEIDNSFGSTSGGSSLTIGKTLTNQSSLNIGSTGLSKATTVTAAALTNSSFINLASGTAAATLKSPALSVTPQPSRSTTASVVAAAA